MRYSNDEDCIYFPIDLVDADAQHEASFLLAKKTYESITNSIKSALEASANETNKYHNAVLVDGARGSGKSTVLGNLENYLKSQNKDILKDVHILRPVDPTLLEEHDDLFINVIIAALLEDGDLQKAQSGDEYGRSRLSKQLQKLGHSLEQMQSQRERKGLDKLRAFVGNHQLIQDVHGFIFAALKLLDKKLLIIVIDDVDTSLHHAFENLEVVRRYLACSYVLPIISGDLSLYHDVIWRNFHSRLLKDSAFKPEVAFERAEILAIEYARKVMPVQYRKKLPLVKDYFKQSDVVLSSTKGEKYMSMLCFCNWLNALINGPVNGANDSCRELNIPTLRALSQLIARAKNLIPGLYFAINNEIASYEKETKFQEVFYLKPPQKLPPEKDIRELAIEWFPTLRRHFFYERAAGAEYLIMKAWEAWYGRHHQKKVLDTPLFQPALHHEEEFVCFNQTPLHWSQVSNEQLSGYRWPESALLHYPPPKHGTLFSAKGWLIGAPPPAYSSHFKINFLINLMVFCPENNGQGGTAYRGRIFELIVLSFLRKLEVVDVKLLMARAPFYSKPSFYEEAKISLVDEKQSLSPQVGCVDEGEIKSCEIAEDCLVDAINEWRKGHGLDCFRLSPWLVFQVMHRFFSKLDTPTGNRESFDYETMMKMVKKTIYSLWSTFAFFEKGKIFEEPLLLSNQIVSKDDVDDFFAMQVYQLDIKPLVDKGGEMLSVTYLLEDHPIVKWLTVGDEDCKQYPECNKKQY